MYDVEDIKLSTSKSLIKKEQSKLNSNQNNTKDDSKKSPEIFIDLNNIFSKEGVVNQPVNKQQKTDINSLESIFNTINFSNNQQLKLQPQADLQANQVNSIFGGINLTSSIPQPTFNILDSIGANNLGNFAPSNTNGSSIMKQVFKNNEIALYCSSSKSNDKTSSNITFYVSNNINKILQNIKLQFSVPKYMERTINSPSGNTLNSMASLGIQQVNIILK